MQLTLFLSKALLCAAQCWPALIGTNTEPGGPYNLVLRKTTAPGYNGSVLQYLETETRVYAIHQVWILKPSERRVQRLLSPNPKDRVITNGCINVQPEVYNELIKHQNTLLIVP